MPLKVLSMAEGLQIFVPADWTPERARRWCDERGIYYYLFYPMSEFDLLELACGRLARFYLRVIE